jgi:hypothetical protein
VLVHRWPIVLGIFVALAYGPAVAQDLTQGKTPAQLFAGDCGACHKSPQGLAKDNDPRALAGFLREHYTTKPEMADALAAYVISNGRGQPPAADRPGQAGPGQAAPGQAVGKPRTASTSDGFKPLDNEGPRQSSRSRQPSVVLGDEPKPSEGSPSDGGKPLARPRTATAVDGNKPPTSDTQRAPGRSADAAAVEDPKGKRKANANDSKKPAETTPPAPSGKLAAYAKFGTSDKDEAAESEAKLQEYATSGEAAPTIPSVDLKPAIASPPPEASAEKDTPKQESGEATKTSLTDPPKASLTDTPKPQSDEAPVAEPKPRKPASASEAKPRRVDPQPANQPLSPTAFFGRLFSGALKPQE